MIGKKVKCPICENDAIVSKHQGSSPTLQTSVPCYLYTCEKDGWFKLSESVQELVTNNPTPEVISKLSKIVAENFFPETLWPADSITPIKLIESLE